jgi:hypothetical protein
VKPHRLDRTIERKALNRSILGQNKKNHQNKLQAQKWRENKVSEKAQKGRSDSNPTEQSCRKEKSVGRCGECLSSVTGCSGGQINKTNCDLAERKVMGMGKKAILGKDDHGNRTVFDDSA